MPTRLERFRARLEAAGHDGAVVAFPPHIYYLSGLTPPARGQTFLVVGPTTAIAVVPGGSPTSAGPGVAVYPYEDYSSRQVIDPLQAARQALQSALAEAGLYGKRVALESSALPHTYATIVSEHAQRADLGDILLEMRRQKDPDEIAAIRRAIAILDAAYATAQQTIAPGVSELEVYQAIFQTILHRHGEPFFLQGDFVSGPRSAGIGGPPTARRLEPGDLFIIDLFPVLHFYKGDLCRTFVVGQPTPEQRALHTLLEEALARGAEALRPGVTGAEVDRLVRGHLQAAGYGQYFPHHSGHAIGLGHPERPYLIPGETLPLAENMVVTLEPGLYRPGFGGMRLEQNFLITASGAEPLSTFPLTLIACP